MGEQLQRAAVLRSQSPEGVRQELWAILLIYSLIQLEMGQIAEEAKVEPYRVSFVVALRFIQDEWLCSAMVSPGSILSKLKRMREEIRHFILPESCRNRRYPRKVKTPVSPFARMKNAAQSLN